MLGYRKELFRRERIERMVRQWGRVLEEMVRDVEQEVGWVELLSEEERREVLEEWQGEEREKPGRAVHELFEEEARRRGEETAVVYGGERISYGELNRRGNRLGRYLRGKGVRAEVRVGICVERSVEMVVGVLGVLKAGGAYVPLDPGYPE